MTQSVQLETSNGVAKIILDRPEKRNAVDQSMLDGLATHFAQVAEDPSVRTVLLMGRGGLFSSGIDHGLLMEMFQKSREVPFRHLHAQLHRVFDAIAYLEKPVIVAAQKYCVGLALELALCADFRVVSPDCVLGLPEVAFGIIPDGGGTTRLIRTVGLQQAREMVMTGRLITANRAERIGLVSQIADDPIDAAEKLAAHFAKLPPQGVGLAKTMVLRSAEVDALTSIKLEGWIQSLAIEDPSLAEHFQTAVGFIKAQIEDPLP